MSGTGWQAHLSEASTQDQLIGICNQFLTMWTREELSYLPEAYRPKDVIALKDVSPYLRAATR